MSRESKLFIYEEAVHSPADVGLSYIYPFFVSIGIPPRYLKVSQNAEHETYSYTFVEVHPKETDTVAGHLQINILKDTDPTYPDVNSVEYVVENSSGRNRDTSDGEAITRILATHGQSTEVPKYKIKIDEQWGITQVISTQQSSVYGMLPHLDKEHRLVGLRFTPNLCGDQPPLRITTMVGDVDLLAVPAVRARRSRLAVASEIPVLKP